MKIKTLYENAKKAKIGESCICPSCNTTFIKESYQQAFCKTKQKTKCKDKYWNTITPNKRNNKTRISPANKAYRNSEEFNLKFFGRTSPNVIGYSNKITGLTSEGYVIVDGTAFNEIDDIHPHDSDNF